MKICKVLKIFSLATILVMGFSSHTLRADSWQKIAQDLGRASVLDMEGKMHVTDANIIKDVEKRIAAEIKRVGRLRKNAKSDFEMAHLNELVKRFVEVGGKKRTKYTGEREVSFDMPTRIVKADEARSVTFQQQIEKNVGYLLGIPEKGFEVKKVTVDVTSDRRCCIIQTQNLHLPLSPNFYFISCRRSKA